MSITPIHGPCYFARDALPGDSNPFLNQHDAAALRGASLGGLSPDQRLAADMARRSDAELADAFAKASADFAVLTERLGDVQASREDAARRREAAKAELRRRWLDGALPPAATERAP